MSFSAEKLGNDKFRIWQHENGFKRVICDMTTEDVMKLYESVVPEYKEEIFVKGDPKCKHSWRPYHLNNNFKLCNNCDAILKIHRLIPRRYN